MATQTGQGKFVERVEMAVMEFAILNKANEGGVTKDNLQQIFQRQLPMKYEHLDHCINRLVQEGHLKQEGNNYRITDDGREDIQQVQSLFVSVPQVANLQGAGTMAGGTRLGGSTNPVTQTNPVGGPKGGPGEQSRR